MGSRPFWVITKQRYNGLEVFTIGTNVLPVFSFEEEAQMFLWSKLQASSFFIYLQVN